MIKMGARARLRIGIVSPPYIRIVNDMNGYGGTERIVPELVNNLIRRGNYVTLFAPEGSETGSKLITTGPALWANNYKLTGEEESQGIKRTLDAVYQKKESFDIIHFHMDEGLT